MVSEDLYLKLDSDTWNEFDFDDTNGITGTIYTDKKFTSAKDITGLTLTFRLFRRWHTQAFLDQAATIVSAANGTWKYLPASGEMPRAGIYMAEIELSSSGYQKSTKPVEFFIRRGPGA